MGRARQRLLVLGVVTAALVEASSAQCVIFENPEYLFGRADVVVVVGTGELQQDDRPGATASHGAFAFPDQHGARLLVLAALEQPELLRTALCTGGGRHAVRFARRQTASDADTGRASSSNFDNLAGSVFEVSRGTVDPDATCFLASESLLTGSTLLTLDAPHGAGVCAQGDRLAVLRDRKVLRCWPLATLQGRGAVMLVEFERRGTNALASVVVIDGPRTTFADYPAEFRGAGQDLWRVDDGGELSPEEWRVVCLLQREERYALAIAWSGAEGDSLSLWIAEDGDRFVRVIRDYFYRAPV